MESFKNPSATSAGCKNLLLGSVSILACGIVLARVPAFAQTDTPTTTSSTVDSNGLNILVNPGVDLTGSPAIIFAVPTGTLSNLGTVASSGNTGVLNQSTLIALSNSGTVSASNFGISNFHGVTGTLTNAGSIYGGATGVFNIGTINTISNISGAAITGGQTGVENLSTIGTLTNAGLIDGVTYYGIENDAGIAALTNATGGTITSHSSGISNDGNIGTLTNSGTIQGNFFDGVSNQETISQLTNNAGGIITGAFSGVVNQDRIGTLTNSGTIQGGLNGVFNSGSIGTLTNTSLGSINSLYNTGLIGGGAAPIAISNAGAIGTLANTGTISGITDAIYNDKDGFVGTLSNAGLIQANYNNGIYNVGTISQLTNQAGGTIINTGYSGIGNNGGDIGTLTNNGLISGGGHGIYNEYGTISQLINQAGRTITGGVGGIINYEGDIGTFINSGLIRGGYFNGIDNDDGTIATLSNMAGGTISGVSADIQNTGFIGTLTNAGVLAFAAGEVGISNDGTITALDNTNTGSILGASTGIENLRVIQTLTNDGVIIGNSGLGGIFNDGGDIAVLTNTTSGSIGGGTGINNVDNGTIGTLTNNGLIRTSGTAILNSAIINTLANNGTITSSRSYGIGNMNGGIVGTLDNYGTISASNYGIENQNGDITALSNTNLITGGVVGINNITGTIGQLINGAGGTIIGGSDAIQNSGVISTLTNSGLITGNENGIFDDYGTIGQLTNNAGGTIIGGNFALSTENGQFGTLTNSGLISGNVGDLDGNLNLVGGTGTIFGTFTNGFIEVPGSVNINLLSGNEILTDNIQALTGNASIGTFTNAGTLQIGTPSAPAAITVKGNYAQTSAGTLNVIVTPAASSQMTVNGNASLAGGVDYIFAPGTYSPKTYNFIVIPQGDGTITGAFTSANYEGTPDTSTTYSADPSANLVLGAGFTFPGGALTTVSPSDSSLFPDQTQALAQAAQSATSSLLGIAASGGAAAAPACESQAALNPGATNDNANIASAIAAELCNHGGWIQAEGALGHVDGAAGGAAYNANTAGFLAGIDSIFGPADTRLGLAIGYSDTDLTDKAGGKGSMGTTRAALYGAQPLGPILITGVAGYGYANDSTTRATFIGGLKQNDNVNIISLGLQASTAYAMPGFEIIPALGIRYANVGAAHFSESASGLDAAFALTGRTRNFNSLQPYATAELTTRFVTPSGYSIAPEITLGGQTEAADRGASTSLFAADSTAFTSTRTSPDPFAAIIGTGLSATKSSVTFYINYNGLIAGNWNTQTGTAGLRITF
jgi:uncharacterized protein with beta-barrel porin domain